MLADSLKRQWLLPFHAAALRNCGKECCDPLVMPASVPRGRQAQSVLEQRPNVSFSSSIPAAAKAKPRRKLALTVRRQREKPESDKALRIPSSDKNMRQQRPSWK